MISRCKGMRLPPRTEQTESTYNCICGRRVTLLASKEMPALYESVMLINMLGKYYKNYYLKSHKLLRVS